jgi:hypothetical protein
VFVFSSQQTQCYPSQMAQSGHVPLHRVAPCLHKVVACQHKLPGTSVPTCTYYYATHRQTQHADTIVTTDTSQTHQWANETGTCSSLTDKRTRPLRRGRQKHTRELQPLDSTNPQPKLLKAGTNTMKRSTSTWEAVCVIHRSQERSVRMNERMNEGMNE